MKLSPLDVLFSEFIRKRAMVRVNGCERCLAGKVDYKQLQTSHFWGRGRKSVRFNINNGSGLCGACHMYLDSFPKEHVDWVKNRLGEDAFDMLEIQANTPQKPDIEAITLYLKEQLKAIDG